MDNTSSCGITDAADEVDVGISMDEVECLSAASASIWTISCLMGKREMEDGADEADGVGLRETTGVGMPLAGDDEVGSSMKARRSVATRVAAIGVDEAIRCSSLA